MSKRAAVVILAMLSAARPTAVADSLWTRRSLNPITDTKARRVGDIVTIVIKEKSEATSDLSETHDKTTDTTGVITEIKNLFGFWGKSSETPKGTVNADGSKVEPLPSVDWDSERKYDSSQKAEAKETLELRLSAIVKEVLPNGNLLIEASRSIQHDRDVRRVFISALVRPEDVGLDNTVLSEKLAQARIVYEGRGPASRTKNKGWGNQIVDLLWPF